MMSSVPVVERCYVCGEMGADTADHVIPRGFFPPPRPSNLLTLPAHYSCHNRLDEEYVRNIVASMGRDSSAAAARLWETEGSVRASFARNPPLRRSVMAGMVPHIEVFSPGGVYLGDAPGIRFDRARVYPSLIKMVRGLYRHHTGRLLERDVRFSWALNEVLFGTREEVFASSTPGLSYGDVFDSRYIVAESDGVEVVAWWLRFYQWSVFRCYACARPAA